MAFILLSLYPHHSRAEVGWIHQIPLNLGFLICKKEADTPITQSICKDDI